MDTILEWLTSVLALQLAIGQTTVTLGSLMLGFAVVSYGLSVARRWVGRR